MMIVEHIPDLRDDERSTKFWRSCVQLLNDAQILKYTSWPSPTQGYLLPWPEVMRLWGWMQRFRDYPFNPPAGDEIQIREGDWQALNGTHRASVLYVLDRKVPAVVVKAEVMGS